MLLISNQEHFYVRITMNELLEKYNDYMRLEDCVANYELKDGTIIEISYKEENFAHLIGLHKLKDLQLIQFWLDKNIELPRLNLQLRHGFKYALFRAYLPH
jgi:hypothetical protein